MIDQIISPIQLCLYWSYNNVKELSRLEMPPLYLKLISITSMECDHRSQCPVVLLPRNLGCDDVLSQDPRDDCLHLHEAKLVTGTAPYASSKGHVGKGLVLEGAVCGVKSVRVELLWIWERPLVSMQQWQQYG